jgi:hypothetical protein
MSTAMGVAFGCYLIVAVAFLNQGVQYLTRSSVMPWHEAVLGAAWQDVAPPVRALLLTQLRAAGAGLIAAGLSIVLLLFIPFRAGEVWARYALQAVGLSMTLPILVALWRVRGYAPGQAPLRRMTVFLALVVAGFVASHF